MLTTILCYDNITVSKIRFVKIDTTKKKREVTIMKIFGYCRISTRQQSIERQIRNIKAEYENAIIITEVYT